MASRPRESVLNLFDPLLAEPSPDEPDEQFEADKENSVPPMADLSMGALFGTKDQPTAASRPMKRLIDVGDSTIINTVMLEEDEDEAESDEDDENDTSMLGSDCATPKQSARNLALSPIHRSPLMEISLAEVTPGAQRKPISFTFPPAARPISPTPSPSMKKQTGSEEALDLSEGPFPFGVPSVTVQPTQRSPEDSEDEKVDKSESIPSAATHTFGVPLASLVVPSQAHSPNKSFGQSFYMGSRQSADFSFDLLNDNISFDPSKWHVDSIDFEGEASEQAEKSVKEHATVFTAPTMAEDAHKPRSDDTQGIVQQTHIASDSVKPSEIATDNVPVALEEVASHSSHSEAEGSELVPEAPALQEMVDLGVPQKDPVAADAKEDCNPEPEVTQAPATPAHADGLIQPPQAPIKPHASQANDAPAPAPVQALRIIKRVKRVEANQLGSHLPSLPKAETMRRASLVPTSRKATPPKVQPDSIVPSSSSAIQGEPKATTSRMNPPKPQLVQPRVTRATSARTQIVAPVLQGAANKRSVEAPKINSGLPASRVALAGRSKEASALPAPVRRIPSAMPRPAPSIRQPLETTASTRPQLKSQQSAPQLKPQQSVPSRLQAPASRTISTSVPPKSKPVASSGINIPPVQGRLGRLPLTGRPRPPIH